MRIVFADAFYFVARLNRHDQHHERVVAMSRELRANLVTTDWVLMEVADALAKSECRPRIHDFFNRLRHSPECEVIPATRELLDSALELYHRHRDKQWTLTDCTSIVIMRERNLTEVLTEDHHFAQAGLQLLLA